MKNLRWYDGGKNNWFSVAKDKEQFYFKANATATVYNTDFQDMADATAKLIYKDWGHKPIYLALSGGVDSEFCATVLKRNNIPFIPLILKLWSVNQYEMWFAEYWCYKNNITPVVYEYNEKETLDIRKKYAREVMHTSTFSNVITLFLCDLVGDLNGHLLSGFGDINYVLERNEFYCDDVDFVVEMYRQNQHPSGFFIYTPDIALSYIHQFDTLLSEQYNKINFYGCDPRPKINYLESMDTTPDFIKIHNARQRAVPNHEPHWHGEKSKIIQLLKPNIF